MPLPSALPRRAVLVAPLAAVLLASACVGSDEPAPATGATGAVPVTIEHGYGTTEIPAEPARIVALGLSDQDPLLALGVAPIAVSPRYGDYPSATWPWAQEELGEARPVVLDGGVRDEANPPSRRSRP